MAMSERKREIKRRRHRRLQRQKERIKALKAAPAKKKH